jgi:ubiquinone/menaquinone biosynthesis C-methylase UbiE
VTSEHEVERLEAVYRSYVEEDRAARRWGTENRGNRAIMEERRRVMGELLGAAGLLPLGDRHVLEVGCGTGHVLAGLTELGARSDRLVGVDLIDFRLAEARRAFPEITFERANAERLGFAHSSFDLLLLFVVLSSILDPTMRENVARECARVLRPGGAVLWYDFRYDNPQNRHVRGVPLREVRRLFPGFDVTARGLTVIPQVARRLGRLTGTAYPLLARIPPLRTYWMALLVKRG